MSPARAQSHACPKPTPAAPRHRLRIAFQEYELRPGATRLGRSSDCRISIDDASLSRQHVEINVEHDRVTVRDLGSRNGTLLNGAIIHGEVELDSEDRLRVGNQDVVFLTAGPPAPMRSTARLRRCDRCREGYVCEAPSCPRCGNAPPQGDWLTGANLIMTPQPRADDWWLELNVDVVERAIALCRLDEAGEAFERIAIGFEELDVTRFDVVRVDRALELAIGLGAALGAPRWIAWALDRLVEAGRAPAAPLVTRLEALPPILIEGIAPVLARLLPKIHDQELSRRIARLLGALLDLRAATAS